jgi:hypothetical protein
MYDQFIGSPAVSEVAKLLPVHNTTGALPAFFCACREYFSFGDTPFLIE